MTISVDRAIEKLTPAMRRALERAWQASWGEWFVPTGTRWDVRRRLIADGFAGRRPGMPLRKLGRDVHQRIATPSPKNIAALNIRATD